MEQDSALISIAMLKAVIAGNTYDTVAAEHGVTRTAVERRIKALALKLSREVGIDGLNEDGLAFVQRLRNRQAAIHAALERYTPNVAPEKRVGRILTDHDIAVLVQRTKARSPCPHRDVALLYVLFSTGARPLEIARLEVRDYLNQDGCAREMSVMREDVAVNHKARPLFFVSTKTQEALDRYLTERGHKHNAMVKPSHFRGLAPHDRLFLTESGEPFEIVSYGESGQQRFLCRGILDAYRKIFRRTGIEGVSALNVRRTVAARLFERGASEDQIGEVLGISEMKAVRELLPKSRQPLQAVMRELV
ncbi:tyrosine-type recombinase/integrase [Noviherbaspirillum sp. ST9]|uniref:tyrosine-type recombinase/integrase n=1 Tax=Noviherbaspirillum sp. ST9 TaxID=3401606 RepID=UPI003B587827